jgi:hypothetical protein
MRVGLLAAALAVVVAAGAYGASAKTREQHFAPFDGGKLARGFKLTKTLRGFCVSGSSATLRSDAWRCFARDDVVDPCFSAQGVAWLACPIGDFALNGIAKLSLTRALPRSAANKGKPGTGHPWMLHLENGKRCSFLTGKTFLFGGKRVSYGCDRSTFLSGLPDRSRTTWTIRLGIGRNSKPKRVAIRDATW